MTRKSQSLTRFSEARERLGGWSDRLVRETRKHPLRTVAVAVGVGFVLGGGVFTRVTARLVYAGARLGVRMAALPLLTQGLVALTEELLSTGSPPIDVGSTPSDKSHPDGKTRRRTHEAQ